MPKHKPDGDPRSAPGARVKAESRASGSATALASTRKPGADTLKHRKNRLTANTVAEPDAQHPCRRIEGLGHQRRCGSAR